MGVVGLEQGSQRQRKEIRVSRVSTCETVYIERRIIKG